MSKRNWIIISIIFILIIILLFIKFFGIYVGVHCGYWNHNFPYEDDCRCIGMKTGGCDTLFDKITNTQCDIAATDCLGIRAECFRVYYSNKSKKIIPCIDDISFEYIMEFEGIEIDHEMSSR